MKTCAKCGCDFDGKKCKPCWNLYMREWNAKNAEVLAGRRKAAYAENKAVHRAKRQANREKRAAQSAAWRAANPQRVQENRETYRPTNQEKTRAWMAANPERVKVSRQNNNARRRLAIGKLTPGLFARLMKLQRGKCPCCAQPLGKSPHMDHVMPLARGGTNTDDNMQLLRADCNRMKSATHPIDYMQKRGMLL